MADLAEDQFVTLIQEDAEVICWGCGLRLLVPPGEPVFKCGWCGAITNQNARRRECSYFWLRRLRDRSFVCVLVLFMAFVICGGVWAVYPVVFSVGYSCGVFHSGVTVVLSVGTVYSFLRAAFGRAGPPPIILWGSYPSVGKGDLENYTFCNDCSAPKSPRTHHCRSCGTCILDMDHHCPFIGNCVGAANHRHFIVFLIMAVVSTMYVSLMSAYAGLYVWPALSYRSSLGMGDVEVARALRELAFALLRLTVLLSVKGLVLFYLFISSVSVQIGLAILLWQQLCYIYDGNTYLGSLAASQGNVVAERGCHNLARFFGCPYALSRHLPSFRNKRHSK